MNRRTMLLGAGAALATPVLLRAAPALSQALPTAPGPAFHRVAVGGLEVTVVTDGTAARTAANPGVVANASPEQVTAALRAAGFPGPEFLQPFNPTVVRTSAGLVALDVGTGGALGPQTGRYLDNLRAAGIDPAQIAAVVLTHLHGDHYNGLTTADGAAVFPNARIMVPQREWAFWTDESQEGRVRDLLRPNFAGVRRRFAPYQGKVETFAGGAEVMPGITALDSPGHTPGHVVFRIADGGQQMMVTGDALHMPPFYFVNPDWFIAFDSDPALAVETRKRLLDQLATDRIPTVVYHAAMPATGRVERAGTGYRLVPANG